MSLTNLNLTAANNTDWVRTFNLFNGAGLTPPWVYVAPWVSGAQYQSISPASVVTFNSDLYVASPNTLQNWVSGSAFPDEITKWQLVGSGASYAAPAFDLTGAVIKLTLCQLDPTLTFISSPRQIVLQLTSDGSDSSGTPALFINAPTTSGSISINCPKTRTSKILPGTYGYDLVVIQSGAIIPAFTGQFVVTTGATP